MYAVRKRHDLVEFGNHPPSERDASWPRTAREDTQEGRGPWPCLVQDGTEEERALWPGIVREGTGDGEALWPGLAREAPETCADPEGEPTDDEDEPTDDEDELFLLGERCAEAYMQAEALHYRAMELLAEFHRREGWRDTGFGSTAEWLAWRIGIKPGAARERVRTALALEKLPETSRAMKNGELSFTKVRALTRVATPDTEGTLLEFARAGSAANLERVVRGWKTLDRRTELTAEQIRHRSRRFSAWVDDDGMVVLQGRLDPEVGALLMRVVEAASDALYRGGAEGGKGGEACCGGRDGEWRSGGGRTEEEARAELDKTTPEQRRADALGLVAERALAAGFGVGRDEEGGETVNPEGVRFRGNVSGSRAQRYQVMLHVDTETLAEGGEAGLSELEDGTRVSAEMSRRLACDASVVRIFRGPGGEVLGAGPRTRTASPAVRRALEARDRGCRFPGCGLRFTDAHHVKHWADGGESTLRNMVLLCRRHHRAVHEGQMDVWIDRDGQVVFFTPKGKAILGAPVARPMTARPAVQPDVRAEVASQGPLASAPRWKWDRDVPWEVEARAWEALDSG